MSKEHTPFKMKGFPQQAGVSPAKHTAKRANHMEKYGKGHTNKDHPNYWKITKHTKDYPHSEGEKPLSFDYYYSDKEYEMAEEGNYPEGYDFQGGEGGGGWEGHSSELGGSDSGRTEADVGKTVYVKGPKKNKKSTKTDATETGAVTEPKKKVTKTPRFIWTTKDGKVLEAVNLPQKIIGGIQKEIRRVTSGPKKPKASKYKWSASGGWKHGGEAKYKKAMEEYRYKKSVYDSTKRW